MARHQRQIGHAEIQIGAVRAVADDGSRRLARLPSDGEHADISGGSNGTDCRPHEIGHGARNSFRPARVKIIRLQIVSVGNLDLSRARRAGDGGDRTSECAVISRRVRQIRDRFVRGEIRHQHAHGVAGGAGGIEHLDLHDARRGVSRPIQENESRARSHEVAGRNERKVLVNGGGVEARVLHDLAGAHPDQIIARRRLRQKNSLDVVELVRSRRVRHRFARAELIAAIECAVRRDDFQIQIVHQRGNCARKSRHVRVGQRDFQRLIRTLHKNVLRINLAVRQQHRLIQILVEARRGIDVGDDDIGQIDAPPAFVVVGNRTGTTVGLVQFIG